MGEYELYHHGIKGMKWGIRRYQNADGSLTEAGKKRQRRKEAVSKTVDSVKRKIADKKAAKAYEELRKKPLSKLTDAELEDRIKRLTKEKQAADLQRNLSGVDERISNGKKFMSTAVNKVVAPALVDAGKEVLTKWLKKQGYDIAGLGEAKDVFSQLKKEADVIKKQREMSDDQRKIRENDLWAKKQDQKEAEERVDKEINETIRKSEEANKKAKQQAKEAEEREASKVYTGKVSGSGTSKTNKTKEKSSKPDGYYDPIDTEFVKRGGGYRGEKWGVRTNDTVSDVRNTSSYQLGQSYVERLLLPDDVKHGDLYHHGVKGMKWGVRKKKAANDNKSDAAERFFQEASKIFSLKMVRNNILDQNRQSGLSPTKQEKEFISGLNDEISVLRNNQKKYLSEIVNDGRIENGRKILEKYAKYPIDAVLIDDFYSDD